MYRLGLPRKVALMRWREKYGTERAEFHYYASLFIHRWGEVGFLVYHGIPDRGKAWMISSRKQLQVIKCSQAHDVCRQSR